MGRDRGSVRTRAKTLRVILLATFTTTHNFVNPGERPPSAVQQTGCKILLLSPDSKNSKQRFTIPYRGGCKGGVAEGWGSFAITEGPQTLTAVVGEFRGGKLNGEGTITQHVGISVEVQQGEFRHDRLWNGIYWTSEASLDGRPGVAEFRDGERIAFCRADRKQEHNCTSRLRKLVE